MRDSQMDVLQLQRGVGNLRHSTLIRRVNAGNHAAAAGQFGKWTLAAGKELPGLAKRRAAETALYQEAA